MPEYGLPIQYEPGRRYTAAQLGALLAEQTALLCWFAAQSDDEPCALGVDFDAYDAAAGVAPVQVIPADYMPILLAVEERAFRQAWRRSGRGKGLLVTYTWPPDGKGWRLLPWLQAGLVVRHFPPPAA